MKFWFILDFFSVLPFSSLFGGSSSSSMNNLLKSSNSQTNITRLVRVTKLFRIIKMGKKGAVTKLTRYLFEKLKMNASTESLIYFGLGFLILTHLSACFWFFTVKLQNFDPATWVVVKGLVDSSNFEVLKYLYFY